MIGIIVHKNTVNVCLFGDRGNCCHYVWFWCWEQRRGYRRWRWRRQFWTQRGRWFQTVNFIHDERILAYEQSQHRFFFSACGSACQMVTRIVFSCHCGERSSRSWMRVGNASAVTGIFIAGTGGGTGAMLFYLRSWMTCLSVALWKEEACFKSLTLNFTIFITSNVFKCGHIYLIVVAAIWTIACFLDGSMMVVVVLFDILGICPNRKGNVIT